MPCVIKDSSYWPRLDQLVADHTLVIDRPKGSAHPRYPGFTYPLDYGYLAGTHASDGDGIDIWVGSLPGSHVTGIVCTVDLQKGEAEIKILCGCTAEEAEVILSVHNTGLQSAVLVRRPSGESCRG
jgi:inorganic pyrophosphatase